MSYIPLQDKLGNLRPGDHLPLDMLREIVDANPHWQFYRAKSAGQQNVGINLQDHIHLVTEFRFQKWTEVSKDGKKTLYHEGKANLIFKDGTKGLIHFDQSNFYKLDVLGSRYRHTYFKLLKPGKLAYAAEEVVVALTDHELIMDGIDGHMQSPIQIAEGQPVMILQTLMLDTVPLVKFLYGEDIRWTYGVLYDKDHFDQSGNDNHWI